MHSRKSRKTDARDNNRTTELEEAQKKKSKTRRSNWPNPGREAPSKTSGLERPAPPHDHENLAETRASGSGEAGTAR